MELDPYLVWTVIATDPVTGDVYLPDPGSANVVGVPNSTANAAKDVDPFYPPVAGVPGSNENTFVVLGSDPLSYSSVIATADFSQEFTRSRVDEEPVSQDRPSGDLVWF